MAYLKLLTSTLKKNCMGRGQTDTQTDTQTLRLLDQIGPVGRFGEKFMQDIGILQKNTSNELFFL